MLVQGAAPDMGKIRWRKLTRSATSVLLTASVVVNIYLLTKGTKIQAARDTSYRQGE